MQHAGGLLKSRPHNQIIKASQKSFPALVAKVLPPSLKSLIRSWVPPLPPAPPLPDGSPVLFTAPLRHAPGNSIFVLPGDIISDSLLATGVWEAELTERLIEDARKGGLMVEVGANLGYFSLLWALLNPTNRVIALEPSPRNLGLFQRSIAASGLAPRIDLLPIAAGNAFGITAFDLGPDAQTGWGGIVLDSTRATQPTRVVVAPLDALLLNEGHIAVLKIDVEGADTLVLEGCRQLLSEKRIGSIYYEQNHPRMAALGVLPEHAQSLLEEYGYHCRPLTSTDAEVVEWEARPR